MLTDFSFPKNPLNRPFVSASVESPFKNGFLATNSSNICVNNPSTVVNLPPNVPGDNWSSISGTDKPQVSDYKIFKKITFLQMILI